MFSFTFRQNCATLYPTKLLVVAFGLCIIQHNNDYVFAAVRAAIFIESGAFFHPFAVLCAGGDDVDSCGVNA